MNDLYLCLEVVQGHVSHCGVNISASISPKLLELVRSAILATAWLLVYK